MVTIVPQGVPAQNFGILEERSQENYEVAIRWTIVLRRRMEKLIKFEVALFSTLNRYATGPALGGTELAEAADGHGRGRQLARAPPVGRFADRT